MLQSDILEIQGTYQDILVGIVERVEFVILLDEMHLLILVQFLKRLENGLLSCVSELLCAYLNCFLLLQVGFLHLAVPHLD